MRDARRTLPPSILWAVGAALVLAVAVIAALADIRTGAAEGGGEQEDSPGGLQPTEIVADIPEGYGELFPLEWGGGSLFHLKGRLATMGCMANTLYLHDGGEWHAYNQYDLPSAFTREFRSRYAEFVPPGRLYATCFRICEFSYAEHGSKTCFTLDLLREHNFINVPYPIDDTTSCTRDFTPIVADAVLPALPVLPEACIMRQPHDWDKRGWYRPIFVGYYDNVHPVYWPSNVPFTVVYSPSDYLAQARNQAEARKRETILLHIEVHELCHINQQWHIAEGLQTDVVLTFDANDGSSSSRFRRLWLHTAAGTEFARLTGFVADADYEYELPTESVYRTLYSINPSELAAELCMTYIFERIDWENFYTYWYFNQDKSLYGRRQEPVEFDVDLYLTPEIRRWLETWVVLPELAE